MYFSQLNHAIGASKTPNKAEAVRFELTIPFRVRQFSRLLPSTTRPRFQIFHLVMVSGMLAFVKSTYFE